MESGEEALVEARRAKLEQLRARGLNPFANDVDTSDRSFVGELRTAYASALLEPVAELRYDPERVSSLGAGTVHHVLGRVIARRGFGKASFLRLRDGSGEIQLFAKKDSMGEAFGALDELDIADHVEARGRAMVTKTGELSLEVSELRVLSKALRPLPDKWHGMTDADLRYRHRYVDFVANPPAAAVIRARGLIVQGLRDFLDRDGFLEVETPTLHTLVGGAAARPFGTHHNALDLSLFLRIAPELYLKRLLVGGFERVYEIGRCYRNEGISTRHNPEFTMLEFYQAYATYETLMDSTERLFRHVDAFLLQRLAELGFGADAERFQAERPFTLAQPFARVPMREGVLASLAKAALDPELLDEIATLAVDPKAPPASADPALDAKVPRGRRASTGATSGVPSGARAPTASDCSSLTSTCASRSWRTTTGARTAHAVCPFSSSIIRPRFRRWRARKIRTRRSSIASSCSCMVASFATRSASSTIPWTRSSAFASRSRVRKKATPKPWISMPTTFRRSSTACRRRQGSGSGSIGW
jgi:lysyl-tRNA synthetase class II